MGADRTCTRGFRALGADERRSAPTGCHRDPGRGQRADRTCPARGRLADAGHPRSLEGQPPHRVRLAGRGRSAAAPPGGAAAGGRGSRGAGATRGPGGATRRACRGGQWPGACGGRCTPRCCKRSSHAAQPSARSAGQRIGTKCRHRGAAAASGGAPGHPAPRRRGIRAGGAAAAGSGRACCGHCHRGQSGCTALGSARTAFDPGARAGCRFNRCLCACACAGVRAGGSTVADDG